MGRLRSQPVFTSAIVWPAITGESAVLSAVIFDALIIVALLPIALRGVRYRAVPARALLLPFPFIRLIDLALTALGGV